MGIFWEFSIFARLLPYEAAKVSGDFQAKKNALNECVFCKRGGLIFAWQ
ncbi:conserved hypothetical protein (plasmid) [Shewanella baltica OS195]|uniref:Uncharacterized protein n=1 Tax=Shewanella baltica (strain OS195) TaxID=399599 RepID=A9L6G3_SHEB9|nr:conserved hypothetical protein [Shewanella baltica OS195]